MNITELKIALPVLVKHKIVPFLWGQQGIGKTQTVRQFAKEHDLGFVHLHLATQEVGDLVGLLIHNEDGTVSHARPSWFPTEGKGIIFLDELNRATPDVLNAVFSLIVGGTIHQHTLPKGWSVVAAGNYQSNAFNVTDTSDAAWMSRFCHIDLQPTREEFILFAEDKGADSVASFIRKHGDCLEVVHKEKFNKSMVTPDRRAWLDLIAPLEKEETIESIRFELYEGIVGPTAAANFMTHKQKAHESLSGMDILNSFSKVSRRIKEISDTKDTRFDLLNSAVEEIFLHIGKKNLTDKQMNNFKEFLLVVPLELGLKIVTRISEVSWVQKNEILNNKQFVDVFTKNKLKNEKKA